MPPKVGTRRYGWRLGTLQNLIEFAARTREDKQIKVADAQTHTETRKTTHTHTHAHTHTMGVEWAKSQNQVCSMHALRMQSVRLPKIVRKHTHTHMQGLTSNANTLVSNCCTAWAFLGPPTWAHSCRKGHTSSRVTHVATMRAVHWLLVSMSIETSPLWPPPQVAAIWWLIIAPAKSSMQNNMLSRACTS